MKKILLLIVLIFVFAQIGYGDFASGQFNAGKTWASVEITSNCLLVTPNDNLQDRYDWLKSSDRDTIMGALAETNRRTLLLTSGIYTLTSDLVLDTNFVDLDALAYTPDSVIITGDDSDDIITQTCSIVNLTGFTIKATATHRGLVIDNADTGNDLQLTQASDYVYYLEKTDIGIDRYEGEKIYINGGTGSALPQLAVLFASGAWTDDKVAAPLNVNDNSIEGTDVTYHFLPQKSNYTNMRFIKGNALANDTGAGVYGATSISGTWNNCWDTGGGACWVCDVNSCIYGDFTDCGSLPNPESASYSRGSYLWSYATASYFIPEIKGNFTRCFGGSYCVSAKLVGKTDNERNYTCVIRDCIFSNSSVAGSTVGGVEIAEFSGEAYNTKAGEESFGGTHHNGGTFSGYARDCVVGVKSFGMSVASGNDESNYSGTLINCVYGGIAIYQAGTVYDMSMAIIADSAIFINCYPWVSSARTANTAIYPFYNGHTYTNTGAAAAVTFTLPDAKVGLKYTFVRTDVGAGEDVFIDPQDGDAIVQLDGTDLGNGNYYGNTADAYGEVTVECMIAGKWQIKLELGTWVGE